MPGTLTQRQQLGLGGIHIGGGSDGVIIRRNRVIGGNGNGITLGSVRMVTRPTPGANFDSVIEGSFENRVNYTTDYKQDVPTLDY